MILKLPDEPIFYGKDSPDIVDAPLYFDPKARSLELLADLFNEEPEIYLGVSWPEDLTSSFLRLEELSGSEEVVHRLSPSLNPVLRAQSACEHAVLSVLGSDTEQTCATDVFIAKQNSYYSFATDPDGTLACLELYVDPTDPKVLEHTGFWYHAGTGRFILATTILEYYDPVYLSTSEGVPNDNALLRSKLVNMNCISPHLSSPSNFQLLQIGSSPLFNSPESGEYCVRVFSDLKDNDSADWSSEVNFSLVEWIYRYYGDEPPQGGSKNIIPPLEPVNGPFNGKKAPKRYLYREFY